MKYMSEILASIEELIYEDGSVLYNINWTDDDGTSTSAGLYSGIELIAVLLERMGIINEARLMKINKEAIKKEVLKKHSEL